MYVLFEIGIIPDYLCRRVRRNGGKSDIIVLLLSSKNGPEFANRNLPLEVKIISDSYQARLLSLGESSGMTRQAITKQQIESLIIPLPPLEKQNDFVTVMRKNKAEITCFKARLNELKIAKASILDVYI